VQAASDGRLPEARIDESVRRILALKTAYNVGPAVNSELNAIQSPEHLRVIAAIYEAVADRREAGRPSEDGTPAPAATPTVP
jgi:hypothetical protein